MAKKQSSKPDMGGEPLTEATSDAAGTITEPLALPAPEPEAEPAKAGTTNAEPEAERLRGREENLRAPVKGGVRKITLNEARALHAAKHLPSV